MKIKYARGMPIRNSNARIDVYYENGRMFTDDLKYGPHLEVVFSNEKQCFVIKDYVKIKTQYLKKHGGSTKDLDSVIKRSVKAL